MKKINRKIGIILTLWIGMLLAVSGCASIDKAKTLYRDGKPDKAVDMAEGLLEDDDPAIRVESVKLIGKVGGEQAGRMITPMLIDENSEVRLTSVRVLGELEYKPAAPHIIAIIDEGNRSFLDEIGTAVSKIGKPAVEELLSGYLDGSPIYPEKWEIVISRAGEEVSPVLTKRFEGKSAFENRKLVDLVVSLRSTRIVTGMIPQIGNPDVSETVENTLIKIGRQSEEPIIKFLSSYESARYDDFTKERLIYVLGELKSRKAVSLLESFAGDESERIRISADSALKKVRGF